MPNEQVLATSDLVLYPLVDADVLKIMIMVAMDHSDPDSFVAHHAPRILEYLDRDVQFVTMPSSWPHHRFHRKMRQSVGCICTPEVPYGRKKG